jgi:hypothetical protein
MPWSARNSASSPPLLRRVVAVPALADVDALGRGVAIGHEPLAAEIVVEDDVRRAQQLDGAQRQQPRVTGPGADDVDLAFGHASPPSRRELEKLIAAPFRHSGERRNPVNRRKPMFLDPGFHRGDVL